MWPACFDFHISAPSARSTTIVPCILLGSSPEQDVCTAYFYCPNESPPHVFPASPLILVQRAPSYFSSEPSFNASPAEPSSSFRSSPDHPFVRESSLTSFTGRCCRSQAAPVLCLHPLCSYLVASLRLFLLIKQISSRFNKCVFNKCNWLNN